MAALLSTVAKGRGDTLEQHNQILNQVMKVRERIRIQLIKKRIITDGILFCAKKYQAWKQNIESKELKKSEQNLNY